MNHGGGRAIETKPILEAGFYWILVPRAKRCTIARCHADEEAPMWFVAGSEMWLDPSEVVVVSGRLQPPEPNEGWPKEALTPALRWY